jgi:osmotically-inducible protein OsmY
MHKPNALLEFDVRDTLDWDPALDDRRITVNADKGCVTLTGSVPTYFDKVRAVHNVWTVGGVRSVDNRLLVGPVGAALNDHEIAAACRLALDHDRLVPKGSVTPTVSDGEVQLRGEVRHLFQRDAAELAVCRVDGVVEIENLIAISPEPIPSDVASRVNKAFARSAIIAGAEIGVSNYGHTIYLTGVVGSCAVMQEAVEIAANAPGVDRVVNDLIVED